MMHRRSVPIFGPVLAAVFAALTGGAINPNIAWAEMPVDMLIENDMGPYLERMRISEPALEINLSYDGVVPKMAEGLQAFQFNPDDGRFAARLVLADGTEQVVSGKAGLGVMTWVPKRRLQTGEILTENDLIMVSLPPDFLNAGLLRDLRDMIGQEVRRPLLADRPIPERALMAPRAVKKGEAVEIRLQGGALNITSTGKALEDAGTGDFIRVINTSSNTIIQAEVVGPGVVRVGPANP